MQESADGSKFETTADRLGILFRTKQELFQFLATTGTKLATRILNRPAVGSA